MLDLRGRTDGWVVPPAVCVAVVAALTGVVLVVRSGQDEQASRHIPVPRSAVVTERDDGRVARGPAVVAKVEAVRLASIVDGLGRQPGGEQFCGDENGSQQRVVFSTASGPVVVSVDLGGCLGVTVASHGSDWGVHKWDRDGVLQAAVAADLA